MRKSQAVQLNSSVPTEASHQTKPHGRFLLPSSMVGRLLVLILFIGLLPSAFIGWLGYTTLYEQIRSDKIRDVGHVAENKHQMLNLVLSQLHVQVEQFIVINQNRCSTIFGNDDGRYVDCLHGALNNFVGREKALGAVIYRQGAAEIRVGTHHPADTDEWKLLPGQLAVFPAAASQRERFFYIPVLDPKTKIQMVVSYSVGMLQPVFDVPRELGASGETFLSDYKGYFITRPRYPSQQGRSKPISAAPMQHCLNQHSMQMLELDYRAEPIIHGFEYIPETGGGCIMAHIEQHEAFAPLKTLQRDALIIAAATLLVILLAAFYLNRRITRPLTELCNTLAGVTEETETVLFSVEGPSEVVALGHAFAGMIARLKLFIVGQRSTLEELKQTNVRLEEAQNHLLQSEKMASIGQLAAGVAHEINNPIGYVYSNLGTLEKYVQDTFAMLDAYELAEGSISDAEVLASLKAAKDRLDIAFLKEDLSALMSESKDGITRVKQIVQNLKDFSHVDNSDEWHLSDLHKGLESTLNIVHNEIKYKATVVKEYGELPEVECHPSQLNQVFMNLLVNASHAIEERGTITIRTGRQSDEVWVDVSDTGKGIAPEHLKKIFDPFFTTKPVGQGTGLGLSLSYGIVQKHQGRIEVASEVGKGTTFRVILPVRQQHLEPEFII